MDSVYLDSGLPELFELPTNDLDETHEGASFVVLVMEPWEVPWVCFGA